MDCDEAHLGSVLKNLYSVRAPRNLSFQGRVRNVALLREPPPPLPRTAPHGAARVFSVLHTCYARRPRTGEVSTRALAAPGAPGNWRRGAPGTGVNVCDRLRGSVDPSASRRGAAGFAGYKAPAPRVIIYFLDRSSTSTYLQYCKPQWRHVP